MSIQPAETAASTRDEARSALGLEENLFDCVSITVLSPPNLLTLLKLLTMGR